MSSLSSFSTSSAISNVGQNIIEPLAYRDLEKFLLEKTDYLKIVTPEEFLVQENVDMSNVNPSEPSAFSAVPVYDSSNTTVTEKEMYKKLNEGLKKILTGSKFKSEITGDDHSVLGTQFGFDAHASPDLFLHFDTGDTLPPSSGDLTKEGENFWYKYGILIEVKRSVAEDPNFPEGSPVDLRGMTKARKELMGQVYRYVAFGQYPRNPYRYIYTITIAGERMRLWKWTATGVTVTDPIGYRNSHQVLKDFLQSITSYDRLGLNVAPNGDNMTWQNSMHFQILGKEGNKTTFDRMIQLMQAYDEALRGGQKVWENRVNSGGLWRVVVNKTNYILVNHPIWHAMGIFGRATRVYLCAAEEGLKDISIFVSHRDKLTHLKTLKTSWPLISGPSEIEFFDKLSSQNVKIESMASKVASGSEVSLTQVFGKFLKQPPGQDEEKYTRTGRWLLLNEVGIELTKFASTRELVSVIADCLKAHNALVKIGILHQDISLSNVLINIVKSDSEPRKGLLIDLDLARDLNDARMANLEISETKKIASPELGSPNTGAKPGVSGTLKYMAIALDHKPVHRDWHDHESFYWILIYCVIRHVRQYTIFWRQLPSGEMVVNCPLKDKENLEYEDQKEKDLRNRRRVLQSIFRGEGEMGEKALNTMSNGKLDFLLHARIIFPGETDKTLQKLVERLTTIFRLTYKTIGAIADAQRSLHECRRIYKLPEGLTLLVRRVIGDKTIVEETDFQFANPYGAKDLDDLFTYFKWIDGISTGTFLQLEKIPGWSREALPWQDHLRDQDVAEQLVKKDLVPKFFPTFDLVWGILDKNTPINDKDRAVSYKATKDDDLD